MQSDITLESSAQRLNESRQKLLLKQSISMAWQQVSPSWPLKNLIAVNPLRGREELPFEKAIKLGTNDFQPSLYPKDMEKINRETIKWCQAFLDEGQASIHMPLRESGLYRSWRALVIHDSQIHYNDVKRKRWVNNLSDNAEEAIMECLSKLNIPDEDVVSFLTLLLVSLPGWASYIKYRGEWDPDGKQYLRLNIQSDYLAMRLIITCLIWPEAKQLLVWQKAIGNNDDIATRQLQTIHKAEKQYHPKLIEEIAKNVRQVNLAHHERHLAQFVFCIDVRSEPLRRSIENQGGYQTFGFAGFFGLPIRIENESSGASYPSCPVLIEAKHTIKESTSSNAQACIDKIKKIYQGLKYTFTTPFILVENLGIISGMWMVVKTLFPSVYYAIKKRLDEQTFLQTVMQPIINDDGCFGIKLEDQCIYAESVLRMIGLTENFSPIIILCGHGSTTENNAFGSALDCGACGGHPGGANAKVMASILNNTLVRNHLSTQGISIPYKTIFLAALHNTTTDEVRIYSDRINDANQKDCLDKIKKDLYAASKANNHFRSVQLGQKTKSRHADWAQTRPEWGLARNAAFIIGPRSLTQKIHLEGRAFLHCYHHEKDPMGIMLTTILTAPMVVAQWINSQYLFSVLDNIAYGAGSKITHNIAGKIGVMQGNASDLMNGLALQSVCSSDTQAYHEPLRLMTVVYAPKARLTNIIFNEPILQKLLGNGWVKLVCIDPSDCVIYSLNRDLSWEKLADYDA